MTKQEIEEQYPKIAKLVWAIQTPNPETIGIYTSKIEREGDFEKLSQWIRYWAKVDCLQAVVIFNKLKKTGAVEKEELKQIILDEMTHARNLKTRLFYIMLAFLYFGDYEKVKDIYQFTKYRAEKKSEKILTARTMEEINVRLKKYLCMQQKCTDVFVDWNDYFQLAQALAQIIPAEEEQQKRQILQEIIQEIQTRLDLWEKEKITILKVLNALQIESQKEVLYISKNCEAMVRKILYKTQKEMETEQEEDKKIAQQEIIDMLSSKLETLLRIVAIEEERTITWLRQRTEKEEETEELVSVAELVEELGEKEQSLREYWSQYFSETEKNKVNIFYQKSKIAQEILYQMYVPQRLLSTKKIEKWCEFIQRVETEFGDFLSEEEKQEIAVLLHKMEDLKEELLKYKRQTIETRLPQIQEMYQMLYQVTKAVYQKGNITLTKVMEEKETIAKEDYEQIQKVLTLFQIPYTLLYWKYPENVANQTWKLQKQFEAIAKNLRNKAAVFQPYGLDFLHTSEEGKQKKIKKAQREMLEANRQIMCFILEKKPEFQNELKNAEEKIEELQVILEKISQTQQKKINQEIPQEGSIIGKKYYIDWLRSQIPELEENQKSFEMEALQDKLIEVLLRESNYSLIFQYIHVLQLCGDYETIHPKVRRFALANKNANREIIQKIVQEFIQQGETHLAFEFLRRIGVKNYLEYMPQEISVEETIEILSKQNNTLGNLYVQKQLFFGKNLRTTNDLLLCTKEWIQYLEETREIQKSELVHEMVLILELLEKDLLLLQNSFVQEKIQQFTQICQEKNISLRGEYAILLLVKVLNQILASPISDDEKLTQIQKLQVLNQFAYKREEIYPFRYLQDTIFSTKKIEAKNLYQEWIKTVSAQNAQIAVDLYMNTHWKHIIHLEDLLQALEQKNAKEVEAYFAPYIFYGKIKPIKTYFRFKIQNVNVLNRTRLSNNSFLQGEDYRTQTFQAKICGYSSIYHEILVKDVCAVRDTIIEMPENEEKSEETNSTLAEIPTVLSKEDEKTYRMLERQCKQIQDIEEDEIEVLKYQAKENPFCFVHWDTIKRNNYWNTQKNLTRVKAIQMQLDKEIDGGKGSFQQMYQERFFEIYQELLEQGKLSEKSLVDLYMNTISQYLIPLEDFIRLLVGKRQGIIDLSSLFQDYPILFKTIQNGKIQDPLLLKIGNLYGTEEMFLSLFMDQIKCMVGKIQSYNAETQKVQVGQIELIKFLVPSKESNRLKQILGKYRDTRDFSVLEELKDLAVIPELMSKSSMEVSENRFIIAELEALTRNIVSLLLGQPEQLQKFLQLLGKNNYFVWREKYGITKHFEAKDAKRIFLEQAKTAKPSTMLDCYQNTYLKYVFGLEELVQAFLQAEKIPQDSQIDVSQYRISIKGKIIAKEETYWLFDCNTAFFANLPPLKIRIPKESKLEENILIQLQVQSYDRIYHIFSCQPVTKTGYANYEEAYVRQYMATVHRILRKNPTLTEIFQFLQTEYMQSKNYWIYRRIEDKCYSQTAGIIRKHTKYWNQTIQKFLQSKIENGELNAQTLNEVFRIYKMGLLKHSLRLNAFLEQCSPILNTMEDGLQEEIKLTINAKSENKYQVYFPKYRMIMDAKVKDCTRDISVSQRYRAKILQYDTKEQCVILHHLRKPKVFQNTTLFTIAPEMAEDLPVIAETLTPMPEDISDKEEELKQYLVTQKAEIQESIERAVIGFSSIEKMKDRDELRKKGQQLQEKIEKSVALKEVLEAVYGFAKSMLEYQDLAVNETGEITSLEPLCSEAKKWGVEISSTLEHEQAKNLNFLRPFVKTEIAEVVAKLLQKRKTYLSSFAFMKLVM